MYRFGCPGHIVSIVQWTVGHHEAAATGALEPALLGGNVKAHSKTFQAHSIYFALFALEPSLFTMRT